MTRCSCRVGSVISRHFRWFCFRQCSWLIWEQFTFSEKANSWCLDLFISPEGSQDGVHQPQKNISYCSQGGQAFALKVLLPYFCHNIPWFIQLLWATGSAYQHQAVIQGNSIIPHLPPAATEEESTRKVGRTMSQNKEEKGTVTPQNPLLSTKGGSHASSKSPARVVFHCRSKTIKSPSRFLYLYVSEIVPVENPLH